MRALLAIIFLLSAQPAFAGEFQDQHGQWFRSLDPDPSWFEKPLLWEPRVHYRTENEVFALCEMATRKAAQKGCAIPSGPFIEIYLIEELPADFRENLLRHELAHAHGWPASHPEN